VLEFPPNLIRIPPTLASSFFSQFPTGLNYGSFISSGIEEISNPGAPVSLSYALSFFLNTPPEKFFDRRQIEMVINTLLTRKFGKQSCVRIRRFLFLSQPFPLTLYQLCRDLLLTVPAFSQFKCPEHTPACPPVPPPPPPISSNKEEFLPSSELIVQCSAFFSQEDDTFPLRFPLYVCG